MILLHIALLLATAHATSFLSRNENSRPEHCAGDLWECVSNCNVAQQSLTGHCKRPSLENGPVCMGKRIIYSHLVYEDNYKLDIQSDDYPVLSRFPRCWNKVGPLICETSFRSCSIEKTYSRTENGTIVEVPMETWNVMSRKQCLDIRAECAQLIDYNLWPSQIDCNDTSIFTDNCQAETVEDEEGSGWPLCFADLQHSDKVTAIYVIDSCALPCRSQWLNEPIIVAYFSILFFIYMSISAKCAQLIKEKLLDTPGVTKAYEIVYMTLLWIKFNPFVVYFTYKIVETSCDDDVRMMADPWFKSFDVIHTWINLLIVYMSFYYVAIKLMSLVIRTTIVHRSFDLEDINDRGSAVSFIWWGLIMWRFIIREEVTHVTTIQLDGFNSTCFFANCSLLVMAIIVIIVFLRSPDRAKLIIFNNVENVEEKENAEPGPVQEPENEPENVEMNDDLQGLQNSEPESVPEPEQAQPGNAGESSNFVEDNDMIMIRKVGKLVFLQLIIITITLLVHILLFIFRIDLPALEIKAYHNFLSLIAENPELVSNDLPSSAWTTLFVVGYHFLINFVIYLPYVFLTTYLFVWELVTFPIAPEVFEFTGFDGDDEDLMVREVLHRIRAREQAANDRVEREDLFANNTDDNQ